MSITSPFLSGSAPPAGIISPSAKAPPPSPNAQAAPTPALTNSRRVVRISNPVAALFRGRAFLLRAPTLDLPGADPRPHPNLFKSIFDSHSSLLPHCSSHV